MTKAQFFIGGWLSRLLLTGAIICCLFFADLSFTQAQRGGGHGESGGSVPGGGQSGHAPAIREAIQQHVPHEIPRSVPQHVPQQRIPQQHVPRAVQPAHNPPAVQQPPVTQPVQQIQRAVQPTHNPPAIQPQPVTQPVQQIQRAVQPTHNPPAIQPQPITQPVSAPRQVSERVQQPRETPTRTTQPRETQPRETQPRETQPRETRPTNVPATTNQTRRENPTSQPVRENTPVRETSPARETRPRNEQTVPANPAPSNPPSNTITNPLGNATRTPHSGSTGRMPVSENSSERVGGTPNSQTPIPAMTNDQVQDALESRGLRPRENPNSATNSSRTDERRTNDRSRAERDRNPTDETPSESRPENRSRDNINTSRTDTHRSDDTNTSRTERDRNSPNETRSERSTPNSQTPIPAMTNDQVQEALESRGLRTRDGENSSRSDAHRSENRPENRGSGENSSETRGRDENRSTENRSRDESRPDGRNETRGTENITENNLRSERGTRTSERAERPERIDVRPSISEAVAAYDSPSSVVNINNGTVNFIRNDFTPRYNSYWTRDWYHYHPQTWWWGGPPHIWWHRPLWSHCFGFYTAGFFAGYHAGEILTPEPYYYGSNIVYQNGMVYINGVPYVSAQEYYAQAQQLAMQGAVDLPVTFTQEVVQVAPAVTLEPTQTIPTPFAVHEEKTPAIPQTEADAQVAQTLDEKEWLPLGTFAVLKDPEQKEVTYILQLATNKDGKMRGNLVQIDTDEARPLVGAVDAKTQRVALSDPKNPTFVMECGLWNLTQDTLTALVHQSSEIAEEHTLVRLTETTSEKEESL